MPAIPIATARRAGAAGAKRIIMKKKPYLDNHGKALPYPWLVNTVLCLVGGSQMMRLRFWSRHSRHAAEKTLRDILNISRDTIYGKEHHFDVILSATNADDLFRLYRQYVPVNNSFETLRPYVERHKQGEENVLFPGKPDMFDFVLSAPFLGGLKPSKECAEEIAKRLNIPPAHCLFVGDRDDTDGESARAFAAVSAAVLYTIVLRRIPPKYNPLTVVFYVQLSALVLFYPLCGFTDGVSGFAHLAEVDTVQLWRSLAAVGYLALGASVVAFICFCYTVRVIGVTRTNAFNNVRPAFTAIWMLLFFGEQLPWAKWLGILLIIIGLFVCQRHIPEPKHNV